MSLSAAKKLMLVGRAAATYYLLDRFDRAESAPIASSRPSGLTIIQNDGSFNVASGRLKMTAQSTPVFGDLAVIGPAVTRAFGVTLQFTWRAGAIDKNRFFGFSTAANGSTTALDDQASLQPWTDGRLYVRGAVDIAAYSAGVDYEIAIVLGGYTSAADNTNLPYFTGDVSLYTFGTHYWIKGGAWADWTKLYSEAIGSTTTLYPVWTFESAADELDNVRLPVQKFTDLFMTKQSLLHRSTWTAAANGDLSAFVPEVGSGWVERNSSDLDIVSNRLVITAPSNPAGPGIIFTTDVGAPDLYIKFVGRSILMTDVLQGAHFGPIFRYVDLANLWLVGLSDHADQWELLRREADTFNTVVLDNAGNTVATNTDYTIELLACGTAIRAWTDAPGTSVIEAVSAVHQTATIVGIRGFKLDTINDQDFASFEVWSARRSLAVLDAW